MHESTARIVVQFIRRLAAVLLATLMLLPLFSAVEAAGPGPFKAVPGGLELTAAVELLEDPAGLLTPADVASGARADEFKPASPRLERTPSAYWLRMQMNNETGRTDWHLDTGTRTVQGISLHVMGKRGMTSAASWDMPFHARPVRSATPRSLTNLTAASLNSLLNFLLVTICHRQFHFPPEQGVYETGSSPVLSWRN